MGDRSSYRLKIWEVQLRDIDGRGNSISKDGHDESEIPEKEVWVRRKQRMG